MAIKVAALQRRLLLVILCIWAIFFAVCSVSQKLVNLETDHLLIKLSSQGQITGLVDKRFGVDYLAEDQPAPLMSVRVAGKVLHPQSAHLDKEKRIISLIYAQNIKGDIKFDTKATHVTFELTSLSGGDAVELIVWGPYPTTIKKIIGETVGVVRGDKFALGLQALNTKTLGGFPWNENDCMPQIDIFDQEDPADMKEKGKRYVLYRVEAAKPDRFGSTLQAYCRNRNKSRLVKNWGHDVYAVPSLDDGGVLGSKIALFGSPVAQSLAAIGAIEQAEGLPHPQIDGQWGKTSPSAVAAYIILEFGAEDIHQAVSITRQAGLRYLYHPDPFENWGHFKFKKKFFPQGTASLRYCVEEAGKQKIMIGIHTLSNFITTNDPYVTPVPDKRLAMVGTSTVTREVAEGDTTIAIESPLFFNQYRNNHLKTVLIDDELIRYQKVSPKPPWRLLNCQRGAFGTPIKSHDKGAAIGKLADHGYKVFLTNPELSLEVSKRLADLFNQTGVRQISFDGLEGNRSTGLGNYGEILFTSHWFNHLSADIKSHFIADASRTSHYFWHLYTRMNWGEPWHAGFRESQTNYRIKNQAYFNRNLMPAMLGWFKMTSETSLEDIEWMLARSAGFDAGYAFVTSYEVMQKNSHSRQILKLLGEWEKIRMLGLLTKGQKERMQNITNEFSLQAINNHEWNLVPVSSHKFVHQQRIRQPGEPTDTAVSFKNPGPGQTMNLIITARQGSLENITLGIDDFKTISLPVRLEEGQSFKYTGADTAKIFNSFWSEVKTVAVDPALFSISPGSHKLNFNCTFINGKAPQVRVEIRLFSNPEKITVPQL